MKKKIYIITSFIIIINLIFSIWHICMRINDSKYSEYYLPLKDLSDRLYCYKDSEIDELWGYKDSDNDGLPDYKEIFNYETDPNNPDTDGDGVNDRIEVLQGKIKIKDADNDLLPDKVEREITKTDPNNPDTDGDGVNDGIEIKIEIINYKKSRGMTLEYLPQEWLEEYEKYKDLNK